MADKKRINKEDRNEKVQFSKKLAGRAEWFWFFYLILLACLVAYQPSIDTAVIYLSALVTIVMITSVLAYTSNSKYDKALYTMRFLGLKSKKSINSFVNDDEEEVENG